jgi:hypothetical protein
MTEQNGETVGPDGFLRTAMGHTASEHVNTVTSGILEFPQFSAICLRLYRTSEGTPGQPDAIPETLGVQVRMTAETAQRLVHQLSSLLSELRGDGHPLQ